MSTEKTASVSKTNTRRSIAKAFLLGAVVHAVLLGASLSGHFDLATWLLLAFAFPGALVDISAEMIHPSQTGGFLIAIVATFVNGGAYALGAWVIARIQRWVKRTNREG